jgi:hypothetical protein
VPRSKKRERKREVMVVPIKEETFAAAKKIHVYAVPIVRSTSDASYIAFYRGAPTSAITHYAKVTKLEKNLTFDQVFPGGSAAVGKDNRPLKVYRLDKLTELKRRVKRGRNPPVSGPRYTKLATLRKARYLDEVWPPEKGSEKETKKEEPGTEERRGKRKGRKKKSEERPEPQPTDEETPKKKKKRRKRGKGKTKEEEDAEPSKPTVHYIVDGSNVALEARTFKSGGCLKQLELVMDKLSDTKGAAVTVLVDANLRHHIDRKDDLEDMINDRRVLQAPAQTDADEFILQTAEAYKSRGHKVIIITNDRYLDYIKKYKPRFDWVKDATKQFMFVFTPDGTKPLEAMITLA